MGIHSTLVLLHPQNPQEHHRQQRRFFPDQIQCKNHHLHLDEDQQNKLMDHLRHKDQTLKPSNTKIIVWTFVILLLAILLFMPRCIRERRETYRNRKRHEIAPYTGTRENPREGGPLVLSVHDEEKAAPVAVVRPNEANWKRAVGAIPKPRNEDEVNKQQMSGGVPRRNPYDIGLSRFDLYIYTVNNSTVSFFLFLVFSVCDLKEN